MKYSGTAFAWHTDSIKGPPYITDESTVTADIKSVNKSTISLKPPTNTTIKSHSLQKVSGWQNRKHSGQGAQKVLRCWKSLLTRKKRNKKSQFELQIHCSRANWLPHYHQIQDVESHWWHIPPQYKLNKSDVIFFYIDTFIRQLCYGKAWEKEGEWQGAKDLQLGLNQGRLCTWHAQTNRPRCNFKDFKLSWSTLCWLKWAEAD